MANHEGAFLRGSKFSADAAGHTGQAGDYAIDFGMGTGPVQINADFLNAVSAQDEMTFALWVKKHDAAPASNSAFWIVSPSSDGTQRGWQVHLPWSDNNIFFDTAGCCVYSGTPPTSLPAATKLLALWNFNDAFVPTAPPTLTVTRSGGNVTVTSDPQPLPAGFLLQTAPSVTGPWTTQTGANTPFTVPIGTENAVFLRAVKP